MPTDASAQSQRPPASPAGPAALTATGLAGIGEIRADDDLAALILAALSPAAGPTAPGPLQDGDIVVISSKVVSKAEGRAVAASSRDGAIATQTVRVVAERITPHGPARIVRSAAGPVMAAAGVDASNVPAGTVLLLPLDADASARALRARLAAGSGRQVGVLISDTLGRPWREGQTDAAIGAAGVSLVEDLRGGVDTHGNPLEVTVRAVADEIAALADLVKGKLGGVPVALVRGLGALVTGPDGPGAAALVRGEEQDWFRYGHLEAVRAALGVPPGAASGPGPAPVAAGTARERLERALEVALAWPGWAGPPAQPEPAVRAVLSTEAPGGTGTAVAELDLLPTSPGEGLAAVLALGAFGQRVQAAGWAEGLRVQVEVTDRPGAAGPVLTVRADLSLRGRPAG